MRVDTPLLKRVGGKVLRHLGLGQAECGLVFIDDERIARLNRAYLGREGATDVISFPLAEVRGQGSGVRGQKGRIKDRPVLDFGPPPAPSPWMGEGKGGGARPLLLGDVVISTEMAKRQALRHGRSLEKEMAHLLIHGILHLLGYDHLRPSERRRMRRLERRLLSAVFPEGR